MWFTCSALAWRGVVRLVAVWIDFCKLSCNFFLNLVRCWNLGFVFCLRLVLSLFLLACLRLFSLAFRVFWFICSGLVLGGFVFVPHCRRIFSFSSYFVFSVALSVFASPLLSLGCVFSRFVVVLVCLCWALICMVSLLYESPRRKPGWRFTAGFKYCCSGDLPASGSAPFHAF